MTASQERMFQAERGHTKALKWGHTWDIGGMARRPEWGWGGQTWWETCSNPGEGHPGSRGPHGAVPETNPVRGSRNTLDLISEPHLHHL